MSERKDRIEEVVVVHDEYQEDDGKVVVIPSIESHVYCDDCPYLCFVDQINPFALDHDFDKLAMCDKVKAYIKSYSNVYDYEKTERPIFCPNIKGDFTEEDKKYIKRVLKIYQEDYREF